MAVNPPEDGLGELLERAGDGDAEAWRTLVGLYSRRVFGLLLKQCGDRDLAEEITQETFVKVVTHLSRYREQGKFEPWLFRIAMNRLRDEMRRKKRHARPMDMSPGRGEDGEGSGFGGEHLSQSHLISSNGRIPASPLERAEAGEEIRRLQEAIGRLSAADQEILYLRHTAGMKFAEIAATLDQPLGTVLARGHRALSKLRKMLSLEDEDQTTPEPINKGESA
ncbi:MAG: sigma-70 family RNA polymerase sigma factor [Phycisphaeraceae bacterium]|nr:sigma-70 family RNA polymerase sigma factor [Phycisphaeraceae bacterium]